MAAQHPGVGADPAGPDDRTLALLFDPGSIARGEAYAREGRVRLLKTEQGWLQAVVKGSGTSTYLVRVSLPGRGRGPGIVDVCTCPLGGACKHVVATILTARRAEPAAGTPVGWRRELARILADVGDLDDYAPDTERLALEITIDQPGPSRPSGATSPRPMVRPLRLGRNGRWVRSGVTWREFGFSAGYGLRDIRPDHAATLKSMLAAARLERYYPDSQPIALAAFGPDLWHHLRQAARVGIELVGAGGTAGTVIVSNSPATVAFDLTATSDGSVDLSVVASLDGEPLTLDPERTATLGTPVHGLLVASDHLHLIPLTEPLRPQIAGQLTSGPLHVPATDVGELMSTYEPLLSRALPVGSSDRSMAIVPIEFEGLGITIERASVDTASVRWSARYRRGGHVSLRTLQDHGAPAHDAAAERTALAELELPTHLLPALASVDGSPRDVSVERADAVTLLAQVVPWLRDRGQVHVEVLGSAPALREATEDPLVSLGVIDGGDDTGGTDWFDLRIEVTVEGEVVPFAALFTALATEESTLVLPSGTWIRLDRPELTKLKELIDEARGLAEPGADGGATARVNRFQAVWWEELTALGVVEEQSARWAEHMARMRDLATPGPVPKPAGLHATLRPYQSEGVDWLAFQYRSHLGGILADDMGLGKTVQAIALCLHVLETEPDARFLVIAPTSVVDNWRREVERFAPGVEVAAVRGTAARRGGSLRDEIGSARIVVTSYALFRIEYDDYAAERWNVLFLDEAQFVKNYRGKTYQCVRRLGAPTKIAMTGTPLENSIMDLWSLLSITAPGLFPDPKRFSDVYRKPIESGRSPELLDTLRRRISPLMRRRTKDAVLDDLPPKVEQIVEVELGARHARIYQTQLQRQRRRVLGLADDVQRHRFEILKSLTLLRQLSLDPGLVDPAHDDVGSAKLDRLEEDLLQVVAEGHRALVFSQFTRYLARVRLRLDRAGVAHSYLDGRTRRRDDAITAFTSGAVPVFVISLKAGGFGLNLTEADYCFVLDPWWNPAVETQAVDRAHRIGQRNPVFVYRYVATGTIEEKVMELKARKAALFSDVVDADGALSGALTADDIRSLFDAP